MLNELQVSQRGISMPTSPTRKPTLLPMTQKMRA